MNVLRHDNICPELKGEFRARFFERLAKPCARSITAQKRILPVTRERQLARLACLIVAHEAFFDVASASVGINDAHAIQDILPAGLVQEAPSLALRHALRSTEERITRRHLLVFLCLLQFDFNWRGENL
jgi:hypothetical protein